MKKNARLRLGDRPADNSYLTTRNMKKTGMKGTEGRTGSSARQVKRTANRSYTR